MSSGGVTGEPPLPESQVMPWQACQTDAMIRDQLRQLRDVRLQQQGRAMTAAEEEAFLLQLQVRSAALNASVEAQNEHYRQMLSDEAAALLAPAKATRGPDVAAGPAVAAASGQAGAIGKAESTVARAAAAQGRTWAQSRSRSCER